jgi:hypothetical protein
MEDAMKRAGYPPSGYTPALWEKITVVAVAVGIVLLVGWLVIRNQPFADPNLVVILRIIISLAVSVLGATVPGFLQVGWEGPGIAIRAGGALALFIVTFVLSPGVIKEKPRSTTVRIQASDQKYHIIRGAIEAPHLFDAIQGRLTDTSSVEAELIEKILTRVTPVPDFQVNLSVAGNTLRFSRGVDIFAPGFGIQGIGSHRKIAQADPDNPLDLDRLWAGKYPGNYFPPNPHIALWLHAENGHFESEQVILRKESAGYFFVKDANQTDTTLSLKARPSVILVDDFSSAGQDEAEAKRLAVILRDALREAVSRNKLLMLSPHSMHDIERVHSELKDLPPDNPGKNMAVSMYAVDHIIRASVVVN